MRAVIVSSIGYWIFLAVGVDLFFTLGRFMFPIEAKEKRPCPSRLGHRYRARYEEMPVDGLTWKVTAEGCSPSALRDLMVRKVYVYDICERCGDVVKRAGKER